MGGGCKARKAVRSVRESFGVALGKPARVCSGGRMISARSLREMLLVNGGKDMGSMSRGESRRPFFSPCLFFLEEVRSTE